MRVGITIRFQNSYFSGSVPQVACALARALSSEHTVTLLYPAGEADWFIDLHEYKSALPPIKVWAADQTYDAVIEVVWALRPSDRVQQPRVISLNHTPPIFHDMESCVYQWNATQRDFTNLTEIWTYDFYGADDVRYLGFLSGLPVKTIPYVWDADALDLFVAAEKIQEWSVSALSVERALPPGAPQSLSWCGRIVESNFSNTSHCVLPLNIVSEIRKRAGPIRFAVHNGEAVGKHPFFLTNISKNLLLPDLSGNMLPRVRLPDLRKEKTFFIAHQRFRPFKSYMLDATYLGFPMIHNSAILKTCGAPYYYELNQILRGVDAFRAMEADYAARRGFFAPAAAEARQKVLRAKFGPAAHAPAINSVLGASRLRSAAKPPAAETIVGKAGKDGVLRVAFAYMWDDFQPRYNFFMYLLSWIGAQHGIAVELDESAPNLVFYGPFSAGGEAKWRGVPKVYFTGENSPPNKDPDTFLNVGFKYITDPDYVRLPLWILEINWFGADVEKLVNPKPVSVAAATKPSKALYERQRKFCAFVATNPSNPNRNAAFHILNRWRSVESGGRLFCNRPEGPLAAGRGGGGGELIKVDYYKDFQFVITYENSSDAGYTTEKLFHAKVAGAVPIYWGDPFVDRDFDARGFINANQTKSPEELIELVRKVSEDKDAWLAMAAVPAVSEFKRRWCERTMEHFAAKIFKRILDKTVSVSESAWGSAESFGARYERGEVPKELATTAPKELATTSPKELATMSPSAPQSSPSAPLPVKRTLVSATNARFAESAVNLFASMANFDKDCKKILYVWPDVNEKLYSIFEKFGVSEIRMLPVSEPSVTPWPDYWDPQHFAWKIWVQHNAAISAEVDECVLYLDAGTVLATPPADIWRVINSDGVFLLDDDTQNNERWCHPASVRNLGITRDELAGHQITAGLVGFKARSQYVDVLKDALKHANNRETIVGEKWHRYSDACFGHRHDQSILSVLTQRVGLSRQPLNKFYCDISQRAAKQFGAPLYVHRGNFKSHAPFATNIDDAYLINLTRRKDRLEKFKRHHADIKDLTYVLPAVDGRTLTLTADLVQCFRENDFHWKKAIMGCALSHLTLWEKLANDSVANNYLIMEDDVKFAEGWLVQWNRIAASMPADADVVYLGGILPPNKPAFGSVVEPVNSHFARVKVNTVTTPFPRRYFHFCNYSYVLTKRGAQKMVRLVKERGIFTSGDHMIVNHGDRLLNIYFTTPLLAGCWQDEDPAYVASAFNNFSRIDTFDSDLWNNDDRFSAEEIAKAAGLLPDVPKVPTIERPKEPMAHVEEEDITVHIWNALLRAIATHDDPAIKLGLNVVFDHWSRMSHDEFFKRVSYFRLFEQLLLSKNADLQPHTSQILRLIEKKFPAVMRRVWERVEATYGSTTIKAATPGVDYISDLPTNTMPVWHMAEITPTFHEVQWLDSIFPQAIQYKSFSNLQTLLEVEGTPVVVYQKIPGADVASLFKIFVEQFTARNKQLILLHLSDEFANDDLAPYSSPAVKAVIRNYWRPELSSYGKKVLTIPLGFASGRGAKYLPTAPSFESRTNIFAFAGSLDRAGRQEALSALSAVTPHEVKTKPMWDAKDPLAGPEYIQMLRGAQFVPCFRGSCALESYRLYEALEHGAIPIYVASESAHGAKDELKELYGPNPFLGFPDWATAATLLPQLSKKPEVMEKHRAAAQKWWAEKKAEVKRSIKELL